MKNTRDKYDELFEEYKAAISFYIAIQNGQIDALPEFILDLGIAIRAGELELKDEKEKWK